MEMYIGNCNRETIVSFMNGLDLGLKSKVDKTWTQILSTYLLKEYNIQKPSSGWTYQVHVYSKKKDLTWEKAFKEIFIEIFEKADEIELNKSNRKLNQMFIENENFKLKKTWSNFLKKYESGDFIEGIVVKHNHFGIFLDLNTPPILGLIRIVSFKDKGRMTPELFPKIGTKIKGIITDFNNDNMQVNISLKPSDFEIFKKNRT